ncbi:MFS transporter [Marinicauda algicola]|uniref:MFS transporter n=1 Tax=Marinicauda algicola TaxID=2029849 RepID=A0A4S2H058_9PROT|nr:MFS transporter [Marinicauda algicola]TGY88895.1 MFS transporter [Marinicauda algicola]
MSQSDHAADRAAAPVYDFLYGDEDVRVCKDIPESECEHQPRNFVMSALALSLTKSGDRLMDPKITLAWMFSVLGVPAGFVGLLAPIRESLALLPQLFIARWIRERPVRKLFWSAGSLGQALALAGMATSAVTLQGATAGIAILALLAAFALSRSVCSVAHKDVVGKTVSKTRRGAVSGYASSVSGLAAGGIGIVLVVMGEAQPGGAFFAAMLGLAALLWVLAAGAYAVISESPGSTEGGRNAFAEAIAQISILKADAPFRRFVVARAGFLATALATPFYVAIAQARTGADLAGLGGFLFASAAASALGGAVWGRLADWSSKTVMIAAGLVAALAAAIILVPLQSGLALADRPELYIAAVFVLSLAHQGVRKGRSTYVVDLGTEETRAAYTAVSNTTIGVSLLAAGAATGLIYQVFGEAIVWVLGLSALLASALSLRLKEVSG